MKNFLFSAYRIYLLRQIYKLCFLLLHPYKDCCKEKEGAFRSFRVGSKGSCVFMLPVVS